MATNKIKNVLVLGTPGVNIPEFCSIFEEYLLYESYEQSQEWQLKSKGNKSSIIFVNNLRFIFSSSLEDSYFSKQIISILSHFEQEETLNAIILLIKPQMENNVRLWKLKNFLLNNFKQFLDIILYVYAFDDKFYDSQRLVKEQLGIFGIMPRNVFEFKMASFYNYSKDNWSDGVMFCRLIYNHIVGDGNKGGLETINARSKLSNKLLLNLIDNLADLLIQTYICINIKHFTRISESCMASARSATPNFHQPRAFGFESNPPPLSVQFEQQELYISDYKRNMTLCHNNDCIKFIQYYNNDKQENLNMKQRKICHASCDCSKINIKNCLVFETANQTCIQCKCSAELHSQNYFKCSYRKYQPTFNYEQESKLAINVLATFYLFKEQNGESFDFKEHFTKFLDLENENSMSIYESFKVKVDENIGGKSKPIVNKDIVLCLNSLYEIEESAVIIPKFMEEIFPKDIRFETRIDEEAEAAENEGSQTKKMREAIVDDKWEMLRGTVERLQHINTLLNSNLKQGGSAAGSKGYLNQEDKGSDSKEIN